MARADVDRSRPKEAERAAGQHGDQREGHAAAGAPITRRSSSVSRSRKRVRSRGAIRRRSSSRSATSTCGTGRIRTSSPCRWCARSRIATARSPRRCCSRRRRSCRSPTRGWIACRSRRTATGRSVRTTRNTSTTGSRSSTTSIASTRAPASARRSSRDRSARSGLSPDGKYFLYWKDEHIWSYDIAANKHVNITKSAPVSFVNAEEDHVGEKPAYGITRLQQRRQVGHPRPPLRSVGGVARRQRHAAQSHERCRAPRRRSRFRYVRLDADDDGAGGSAAAAVGGRGGGGGGTTIDLVEADRCSRRSARPTRRRASISSTATSSRSSCSRIASSAVRSRRRTPIACWSRARRSSNSRTTG